MGCTETGGCIVNWSAARLGSARGCSSQQQLRVLPHRWDCWGCEVNAAGGQDF